MIKNVEVDHEVLEMKIPQQFEPLSLGLNEDMALISAGNILLVSNHE